MNIFNRVLIACMGRVNQIKINEQRNADIRKINEQLNADIRSTGYNFTPKVRLNVNDLMKKRQEERRVDKKTNILIFSGVTVVTAVVLVILSL